MKKLVCVLALFLIVFVALFPMLLSFPLVTRWILPQTITVARIQAGWFEGVQIDGLVVKDSKGLHVASVDSIIVEKPLISWFSNFANFGKVVVVKPIFELPPVGPLFFEGEEDDSQPFIPDFFTLDIRDAAIHFSKTEVTLFDLNCHVDIKQKSSICATLSSKLKNKEDPGAISLELAISNIDELKASYLRALVAPETTLLLHAKLVSFPTAIIDPSLFKEVGETVDCEFHHAVGRDGSSFDFAITSALLNGRISSKKKGHLTWERPSFFTKMTVDPNAAVELAVHRDGKDAHCRIGASFVSTPAVTLDFHAAGNWPELLAREYTDILGKSAVINARVELATILEPGLESSGTCSMQSETGSFTSTISCIDNLILVKSKSESFTGELKAPFEIDQSKVKLEASIALQGAQDKLELSAGLFYDRIAGTFSSSGTFHAACSFLKESYQALIGPSLSGNWSLSSEHITAHLEGEQFLADLNLALGKKIAALGWKKPLKVAGTLTPERFHALFSLLNGRAPKLILLQPAPFALSCSDFSLRAFDLWTIDAKLQLQLGALVCQNLKTDKVTRLPELAGNAIMQSERGTLSFEVESQNAEDAPYLFLKGNATTLWNEKGVDLTKADINLDITLKEFPLDHLPLEKLVKIAGSKVDVAFNIDIEKLSTGKARGALSSDRLKVALDLLIQEGKLLLTKPLTATFSLPHKTEGRVTVIVDTKGFSLPLAPFSLKAIVIPSIILDPGIITVENGGLLGTILSLLRLDASSHGHVPIWFTPLYLDVKEGIVTCKRTDLLVSNAFPMSLWGKIDLQKDSVDFKLGLPGQTLRRAFGIIIFSSDYLLQIPIQGSIESPKLDTAMATAKIAALRLQQTPMPTTMIFGGILGIATSVVDKNEKPPRPTTVPFPWDARKLPAIK